LTIVLGAEVGILVCLSGSLFLIIRHSTFPTITIRGRVQGTNKFTDLYVCTDINLFDESHDWFHQANQFSQRGKKKKKTKTKETTQKKKEKNQNK
jgi:MFS superfamily sulfate permease-like transporter